VTQAIIRLPDEIAMRVQEIMAGGREPAQARDASTVVLLRPAASGSFEVYLLRRRRSMAFAPGAHVFPGGSVDPRDADADLAWAGPDPAEWGRLLMPESAGSHPAAASHHGLPGGSGASGDPGVSPGSRGAPQDHQHSLTGSAAAARALICAAVRETFEESGVLLAGPTADTVVADTRGDDWETDRHALIDRSLSLAGLLQRRGLVLRSDLLKPWARWITPAMERRRFDTRFFAAALPEGQRTRHVGGEADEVVWLAPSAAIGAARKGEILLMPPTAVTLAELARHDTLAGVLAASGDMAPRQPEIAVTGDTAWLTIPDGLEYPL
jgi:8-oxo-dGTP pyrophosphatase MutT (NUDIX family)